MGSAMKIPATAALFSLFVFDSASLQAALLTVQNHSFENPATGNGTFVTSDTSAPTGWSIYGTTMLGNRFYGVLNPAGTTLYTEPAPDDDNVGVVFLFTPGAGEGGLEQALNDNLELNTEYTLTVDVGNIANDPNPPHSSFNFSGFPGYRIELLAGGNVIAADNNSLSIAEGAFETSSVQFTTGDSHANAGQPLSIRLINLNGSGIEVNFDNVLLDAVAIPEPSTSSLFAGAFVMFFAFTKRRS